MEPSRPSSPQSQNSIPCIIRPATASDAPSIASVLRAAFAEFEPRYTPAAFAATVLSPAAVLARLREGPLWVAEASSDIIGTVGAKLSTNCALVRGMAVSPTGRGLGLGLALLRQVEEFAVQQDAIQLELFTTPFLDRAIGLYRSAGFAFTGERSSPNGTELLRMTKQLNQYDSVFS